MQKEVLARAHHRKGVLHRLCRERDLLRIIEILRLSDLVYPFVHSSRHPTQSWQTIVQLENANLRETVQMFLLKASWRLMLGEVLVAFRVCIVIAFVSFVCIALVTALLALQGLWHARPLGCREATLSHGFGCEACTGSFQEIETTFWTQPACF